MYALRDLVAQSGYLPELHVCGECQKSVSGDRQWFVPEVGAVLHSTCRRPEHIAMRCPSATFDALESDSDPWSLDPAPAADVAIEGIRLLSSHLGYQIDHKFRSMALLRQLVKIKPLPLSQEYELAL
jgi:hypothetical protein